MWIQPYCLATPHISAMFLLCDPWPTCPLEKAVWSSQRGAVLLGCLHQQGGVGHRTGRVPHPHGAVQRWTLTLSCIVPQTTPSIPLYHHHLFFHPPLSVWEASSVSRETVDETASCLRLGSFLLSFLSALSQCPHSADCWRSASSVGLAAMQIHLIVSNASWMCSVDILSCEDFFHSWLLAVLFPDVSSCHRHIY